jgi:tRNA 2-thiouridine synthesizing protein E
MSAKHQSPRDITGKERSLRNLKYWSIITAYGLAAAEGIKLTPLHLDMLDWLRQDYAQNGPSSITNLVLRLEAAFADQGGNLLLMSLFPEGHTQALKIAGLPVQPGTTQHPVSVH